MGVSFFKIKKWTNMLFGKSVYHVTQAAGRCYSKEQIKGYYNDFTQKVSRFGRADNAVPTTRMDTGEEIYFSIAVFQYGLAAYDLYCMEQDENHLEKFINCAAWAVENQQEDGSWVTFAYEDPEHPNSSMAQGEGISLLLRAYIQTGDESYMTAAVKAKDFMLLPISQGGTTLYKGEDVYFYEFTHSPLVLNGWIFSIFGLYDYCKLTGDAEAREILQKTLQSLANSLPGYDNGYWSKYDDHKRLASPFYHDLHIAQLKVMYDLFEIQAYAQYAHKWDAYRKRFLNPKRAFVQKALQKILE